MSNRSIIALASAFSFLLAACVTVAEWNIAKSNYICGSAVCEYEVVFENLTASDLTIRYTVTFSEYRPNSPRRVKGKASEKITIAANSSYTASGLVEVSDNPNSFKVDVVKKRK